MLNRQFVSLLAVMMALAVLLSGCFRIHQEIDLSDGGPEALVTTQLEVEKSLAGAEMDLFLDSLRLSVPGLETQATHRRFEITRDFSEYVVYVWEGNTKVTGNFTLTEREDGSYEFRYPLRKVEDLVDDSSSSTVIMQITVKFPKDVDFANTMNTQGNVAVWELTKNDLTRGVELRAFTVAE